jgi:phage recombination protein Bet
MITSGETKSRNGKEWEEMNEIVKFESENGQIVQFGAEDVKQRLCPNIDDKELALVMALCQQQRLNPFTKDVYIIKYGNSPASIVTSKDVFTKRANSHPDYEGFEAGVTFIDRQGVVKQREGSAVYAEAGEKLVGGWCRVFVKGRRPVYDEVTLSEYSTGKSGWGKMPGTLIRKVALVHSLREAFSQDFQGLYSQEEMDAKIEQDKARESRQGGRRAAAEPLQAEYVEMISEQQHEALQAQASELAIIRGVDVLTVADWIGGAKKMQALGYVPNAEMTAQQAETALQLLAHWLEAAREQARAAEIEAEYDEVAEPEQQAPSALDQAMQRTLAAIRNAEQYEDEAMQG